MVEQMSKTKILLVEDDTSMGFLVKDYLEMMGFKVTLLTQGNDVLPVFTQEIFHLCLFDVMLPQKDGFTLVTDIRRHDPQIPVIFLTAKNMREDRLKGFRLGADDYITKPFSIEELHLRIEAVLKRAYPHTPYDAEKLIIRFGNSIFDTGNQCLIIATERIDLTYREAKLLKVFCTHKNKLLERHFINQTVWEDEGIIVGRSVDVFISRLRKFLKNDPSVKISNIHSVGYRFDVID